MENQEIKQLLVEDIEFYENSSETYGKYARLSLAGSYITLLSGVMSITNEQTPRSILLGVGLIGSSALLRDLKRYNRESEAHCESQIDRHQQLLGEIDENYI